MQTNINIRIDQDLKNESEELLKKLGLTMTSAMNIFLRQVVLQRKIPFEITLNEEPNEETKIAMRNVFEGKT